MICHIDRFVPSVQAHSTYTVKNGHRQAGAGGAKVDNFVFSDVGIVSGRSNVLRVCEPIRTGDGTVNRLGVTCDKRTERPKLRYCHAVHSGASRASRTGQSVASVASQTPDTDDGLPLIEIGWRAVDSAGGLHRGYTITAFFALNNSLVWDAPFFVGADHVSWAFRHHQSVDGGDNRFSVHRNVEYVAFLFECIIYNSMTL